MGQSSTAGNSLATVVDQIGADDMWAAGYTGEGVDVAVIDTGVAPITELSTTDVFVGPDLSFEGGVDAVAGLDSYGHGTHMIGIIAGRTLGADPLHPRPATSRGRTRRRDRERQGRRQHRRRRRLPSHRGHRLGRPEPPANGLNIRVLNLSYNTDGTQKYVDDPLSKAVENAWNHGIVVVVSAGNEGRAAYGLANPATNPTVIAVSAAELFNRVRLGRSGVGAVGRHGPQPRPDRTWRLDRQPAGARLPDRHRAPRRHESPATTDCSSDPAPHRRPRSRPAPSRCCSSNDPNSPPIRSSTC